MYISLLGICHATKGMTLTNDIFIAALRKIKTPKYPFHYNKNIQNRFKTRAQSDLNLIKADLVKD